LFIFVVEKAYNPVEPPNNHNSHWRTAQLRVGARIDCESVSRSSCRASISEKAQRPEPQWLQNDRISNAPHE